MPRIQKAIVLCVILIPLFGFAGSKQEFGWGAHPIIGYDDLAGWTFGASNVFYYDADSSNDEQEVDELDLVTTVTTAGAYNVGSTMTKYLMSDKQSIEAQFGYEKSFQNYYGFGDLGEDSVVAKFTSIDVPCNIKYSLMVFPRLSFSPLYDFHYQGFQDVKYQRDTDDPMDESDTYSSGIGFEMSYKTTNPGMYKHSGYRIGWGSTYYSPHLQSSNKFELSGVSFRSYLSLPGETVLGFQFRAERATGDVPIFYLPAIGGSKLLRGFDDGKYRAKNSIVGQTEFRFPIWWRLGGTVFVGAGEVADHYNEFDNDIKVAGGIGMRLMVQKKKKINVRFDFTYNSDGESMKYIKIQEAF